MVLFKLVRDEVLARHFDRIQAYRTKAAAQLTNLEKFSFQSAIPKLPELDLETERKNIEQRLLNPAPGVPSVAEDDYSSVSLEEVARRGIDRQRPANANGEELRDVMLWLMTIAYAKKQGGEVGFIAADGGFRDGEQPGLHPNLRDELSRAGVTLHFARGIEDFVKAHAPAAKAVTRDWVLKHLKKKDLIQIKGMFKIAAQRLAIAKYELRPMIISTEDPKLQFKGGDIYRVSKESEYVELHYEGSLEFDVNETIFQLSPQELGGAQATITAGQVFTPAVVASRSLYTPYGYSGIALSPISSLRTAESATRAFSGFPSSLLPSPTKSFLFSASFVVSIRISNNKLSSPELDPNRLEVLSIKELSKKSKI